ncbi:hypothetical protein H5V45_12330 [Nocardioides sp. KIGAM211]|uniref:Uncharacterized protein n=1 Tax=Nocardioides luti TaxID=2761101 RepID=A0A7X0VBL8_9ACTN|nr:hypothetical protein [Nocardioides luti]MBB6628107.1 hypothetical protein [Nocardioides luti]
MSSIDDLRSTLERHADGLADHDLHVRPVAVRARVRAVRRRRRSVLGGVAAAVVAAAVATTLAVGADRSAPVADRTLAGHVAPASLTSLGYTYAFDRARQGDGRAVLDLPESERPRLLSWATEGTDDRVVLRAPGEEPRVLEADDFGDFTFVPPRSGGRFTLTGTGPVALAAYDLTDAVPAGATAYGVTFRDEVAGQRLAGVAIGDPGDADVAFVGSRDAGPIQVSYVCAGGPKGAWIHISQNGEQLVFGGGCDDPLFDPAGRGGYGSTLGRSDASDLTLRMWVTDGEHGPVVEDPDLRIGVAAYTPAPAVEKLAGTAVARTVEHDGHLWTLVDTTSNEPGARTLEVAGVDGRETLAVLAFGRTGRGVVRTLADGRPGAGTFAAGGSGSTEQLIPAGDHTVGLRATGARLRPDLRLGVARYVRAE